MMQEDRSRVEYTIPRRLPRRASPSAPPHPALAERQSTGLVFNPGVGIIADEDISIEVKVISQRAELGGRRDQDRGLDHAAEHDPQSQGPGEMHHPQGRENPTALHQLDVDAMEAPGELRYGPGQDGV